MSYQQNPEIFRIWVETKTEYILKVRGTREKLLFLQDFYSEQNIPLPLGFPGLQSSTGKALSRVLRRRLLEDTITLYLGKFSSKTELDALATKVIQFTRIHLREIKVNEYLAQFSENRTYVILNRKYLAKYRNETKKKPNEVIK